MKLASIDIGTNTLRLLIGSVNKDGVVDVALIHREITRLGGGFDGVSLHPDAKSRTLDTLKRMAGLIAEHKVSALRAVATSVAREAEDGKDFVREIKQRAGIDVEIISGEVEAALTVQGALSGVRRAYERVLIFDIGGGSTEFVAIENAQIQSSISLNMGVVSLAEKYLCNDPPSEMELKQIQDEVRRFISKLDASDKNTLNSVTHHTDGAILIGVAGTITSLAALDLKLDIYDGAKVNNHSLTLSAIRKQYDTLVRKTHAQRAAIKALEEGRADLILPGIIIVLETMRKFEMNELIVSDFGLIEGLLIDLSRNVPNVS